MVAMDGIVMATGAKDKQYRALGRRDGAIAAAYEPPLYGLATRGGRIHRGDGAEGAAWFGRACLDERP